MPFMKPHPLSDEDRAKKNKAIAESMKRTKERRKTQKFRVFELKVQSNKLSKTQKEALFMLFVESKWLYNDCIASDLDPWDYKPTDTVTVKNKDGKFEERKLTHLGAQHRQSVIKGIVQSCRALSAAKKRGKKIGMLGFISNYTSLDLRQAGMTHRFRGSKVKIQNIPGWIKVHGSHQLDKVEVANARLTRRPDGYYLKVTAFIDNDKVVPQFFDHGTVVGIDMGVKTHITVSDGREFNVVFGETDRLKRLQKKLRRQTEGSNKYNKTLRQIRIEYQRMDRKKDDAARKIVHELTANEVVVFQDESIAEWKRRKGHIRCGKKIQHSVLGRVKQLLILHPRAVMLGKFQPTTKRCPCGTKTPHDPEMRTFVCSSCGWTFHRDKHAANMMIVLAEELGRLPNHISTSGLEGIYDRGANVKRALDGNAIRGNVVA